MLLQSSGSFFAFAPVLKALQKSHLPLAQFLAFPGTGFSLSLRALPHSLELKLRITAVHLTASVNAAALLSACVS